MFDAITLHLELIITFREELLFRLYMMVAFQIDYKIYWIFVTIIKFCFIFKLFSFRLHLLHCQIPCYCYRPFVCYIPFHLKLLLLLPVKQINTKFNVRCTYTHMHRLFLYTVKCLAIVIVRLSAVFLSTWNFWIF